jgi:hypothetical protein
MAHICAVAGREPAKVGKDSEFKILDRGAKTADLGRDPLDRRRVPTQDGWTCTSRLQVILTGGASSDFGRQPRMKTESCQRRLSPTTTLGNTSNPACG